MGGARLPLKRSCLRCTVSSCTAAAGELSCPVAPGGHFPSQCRDTSGEPQGDCGFQSTHRNQNVASHTQSTKANTSSL